MNSKLLSLGLTAALLVSACAGTRAGAGTRDSMVIAAAEIEQQRLAGVQDLHELVTRVRPRWLQMRSERSLNLETTILVYKDAGRLGGVDALRGYPLENVTSIRYLDSAQAGALPGNRGTHVQGAIVISTKVAGDASR